MDPNMTYDNVTDTLVIRFDDRDGYAHYCNEHIGTIHDKETDAVVGIQIDAWSIFKAEQTADAKQMRAYIPKADEPPRSIPVTLNPPKVRPSFVIDPDDYD